MAEPKIIIAVDGHSSCGKSTLSKQLAKKLRYNYIDTGAMYRAVAFFAMQNNLIDGKKVDEPQLISKLDEINIEFLYNEQSHQSDLYLNGVNVETAIRSMEVSENVSPVATIKQVREALVKQQQRMGLEKGIVMDGRDIGTVVFPDAELKIFMTASPEVRAQRRFDEMQGKDIAVSFDEVLQNVNERDHIDSTRDESPLRKAPDALVLDNSYLSRNEQLDWAYIQAIELIKETAIRNEN